MIATFYQRRSDRIFTIILWHIVKFKKSCLLWSLQAMEKCISIVSFRIFELFWSSILLQELWRKVANQIRSHTISLIWALMLIDMTNGCCALQSLATFSICYPFKIEVINCGLRSSLRVVEVGEFYTAFADPKRWVLGTSIIVTISHLNSGSSDVTPILFL